MGKHDDQPYRAAIPGHSQQVSSNPNHLRQPQQQYSNQQRPTRPGGGGLMPTDGQDAYKRSQNRASRRSRAERTSYLVATGHLDPEETQRLNSQSSDSVEMTAQQYLTPSTSPMRVSNNNNVPIKHNISDQTNLTRSPGLISTTGGKRSNFEQSFLDDLNRTLANSPPIATNLQMQQAHEYKEKNKPKRKDSRKKYKQQKSIYDSTRRASVFSDDNGDDSDRRTFRQTYTEVSLPMKTSPAFEYILKDNERRNKRCCLWCLYSILMTICLAIIIFCCVQLILRNR